MDDAASAGIRARFARELRTAFLDARRIATQLRAHAGRAPYAHPGLVLRQLAEQAEAQVAALAGALRDVAGNIDPADHLSPRDGRNHWERLSLDLTDLETLKRRYVEIALRWDVDFPDTAEELRRFGRTIAAMSRTVRDMLARSDPHAA
jgi:hypothetical protein